MTYKKPALKIWQDILIASCKFGLCVFLLLVSLFTVSLLFFPAKAVCGFGITLQCILSNICMCGLMVVLYIGTYVLGSLKNGLRAQIPEIQVLQEGLKRTSYFKYFSEQRKSAPTSLMIPWHTIHGIEIQKEEFCGFASETLILICPSGILESCSRMRSRHEVEVHLSWPLENPEAFKREVFQFISKEHPLQQFLNQC